MVLIVFTVNQDELLYKSSLSGSGAGAPAEKEVPTAMRGRLRPAAERSARCTPRATSGTSPASRS